MRSEQEKTVSDLEKEKHISVAKDTFLRCLSVIQHVVKTCCCRRVSRRRSLVRQPAHGRRAQRIHRVRHAAARRAASRMREPPRAMMSCWHGMCCAYSGASRSSGVLHLERNCRARAFASWATTPCCLRENYSPDVCVARYSLAPYGVQASRTTWSE